MMHFLLLHGVAFHISQFKKKGPKIVNTKQASRKTKNEL